MDRAVRSGFRHTKEVALFMNLEEMQRLLERQQSRDDILNLMGRYQYYHTGGQMSRIGRELFAWWLPDARCEYGPLGVFGAEKSLQFFDAMTQLFTGGQPVCLPGLLEIHQITTPVVEVAEDNQTAKGMWMSTGAILMLHDEGAEEGRSFTWDSGKYAVDFIRTEQGWRVWHLHVCDLWRTDFTHDPVANATALESGTTQEMIDEWNARAAAGETVCPHGMPIIPDGPTTFHYTYASDSIAPQQPQPPVPYRTFAETFAY
jgi:hypothetical protein